MKRRVHQGGRRAGLAAWGASVLGTAAVFYGFPEWPSRPVAPRPACVAVSYGAWAAAASSNTAVARALAAVYSPVTIALPEHTPGSRVGGTLRDGARSPVDSPAAAPLYLFEAAPAFPLQARETPGIVSLTADRLTSAGAPARAAPPRGRNGGGGLTIALLDGLEGKRLDAGAVTLDEWTRAPAPWTLRLYVYVDETGRPRHAFLETVTTNAALNAAVRRELFRCRFEPAGAPCEGRVSLYYAGRESGAPAP